MTAIGDIPSPAPARGRLRIRAAVLTTSLLTGVSPLLGQPQPWDGPPLPPPPPVKSCEAGLSFRDATTARGLIYYGSTYGHAIVDMDNDGDEDLVISNHGRLPRLYLNDPGGFVDHSHLLPIYRSRDRHGITAADLDNDGDRDLLIAGGGGGADSVTGGLENQVLRNLLAETGELDFEPAAETGLSLRGWRGRHFLPLPSGDGRRVDLYFLAETREGKGNVYLRNRGGIRYLEPEIPGLGPDLYSKGLDVPLDFDRDGDVDLLLLSKEGPQLLANLGGRFERVETPFDGIARVSAAAAGDLDRDGYPEIYLGTHAPIDTSDQVLWDSAELHFVTYGNRVGDSESMSFLIDGDTLEVDLAFGRGLAPDITDNVFVGRDGLHPSSLISTVAAADATGKPSFAGRGVYLWHQTSSRRWHVEIHFAEAGEFQVGRFYAPSIRDVRTAGMELFEVQPTRDRLYRNLGGSGFEEIDTVDLAHHRATRSVTMVDLDLNGWPEVAVVRGAHWGIENGKSFVLTNCGERSFGKQPLPNPGARLYSSNQVAFGLLDEDHRPDLFLTNGWGPSPSNRGPYRLLLNDTPPVGDAVLLELVGSRSNRDAIGAQVEIIDDRGQLLGYRLLAYRGLAQDSRLLVFGLGEHEGPVFARIRWPGGREQTTKALTRNKKKRIREPAPASSGVDLLAPAPPPPTVADDEPDAADPAPAGEKTRVRIDRPGPLRRK